MSILILLITLFLTPIAARASDAPPPVPNALMQTYEGLSPNLLQKTLYRCGEGADVVFKISWSSGYVEGDEFYAPNGRPLGSNLNDDTGNTQREFNDTRYKSCVQIKIKKKRP